MATLYPRGWAPLSRVALQHIIRGRALRHPYRQCLRSGAVGSGQGVRGEKILGSARTGLVGVAAVAITVAVGASTAAYFILRSSSAEANNPPAAAAATPVSVATVEQRDIALWDEFSGRLEAVERVEVRSRVAGAVQAVALPRRRAGEAGRPADHHRPGALRRRGRPRAGAGRGRAGARAADQGRARARRAALRLAHHLAARPRPAAQREPRGRGEPRRRARGAAGEQAQSRLHAKSARP